MFDIFPAIMQECFSPHFPELQTVLGPCHCHCPPVLPQTCPAPSVPPDTDQTQRVLAAPGKPSRNWGTFPFPGQRGAAPLHSLGVPASTGAWLVFPHAKSPKRSSLYCSALERILRLCFPRDTQKTPPAPSAALAAAGLCELQL